MFHQTLGYIIVVSGESNLATLERIGQNLEIDVTDNIISSKYYYDYSVIMDGGLG